MMSRHIPLSVPSIHGNEWKYVKDCLDSGWVSSVGAYVDSFERSLVDYTGSPYAVATASGTAALHVSLLASGIRSGDEVIVPTLTFVATANAVRYCGAEPVFMDCDRDTLCIDVEKINAFLEGSAYIDDNGVTFNRISKRPIRAIIPVHLFGHPSDMEALNETARRYNLFVIEDATESLGSEYMGKKTGSFGKAGCFSFNGNKIITTGGGGMVVTDNEGLSKKIRHLTTQARSDSIEYDHDEIGFNYRLTNVQAAIGVAQMEKIGEFIHIKRKNAELYRDLLAGQNEARLFWEHDGGKSNFWYITIKVPGSHKMPLMEYLQSREIQTRPIWKPLHTLPMYRDSTAYDISNALEAYDTCMNLPCSIDIREEDIEFVVKSVMHYFNKS